MDKKRLVKFYFPISDLKKNTFEGTFEARVDKINMNKKREGVKLFIGPVEVEIPMTIWEQLIKG
jgi:hypothetical protein